MSFLNYLLLGVIAYASGWALRIYVLDKRPKPATPYSLTHPTIMAMMAAFFVIMLGVSWAIGRFILAHQGIDIAYLLVNSAVATFVFSFGLSPDQARHDLPD